MDNAATLAAVAGARGAAAAPGWDPTTPGNVLAWYFVKAVADPASSYCFENDAGDDPCEDTDICAVWKNRANTATNTLIKAVAGGDQPLFESTGWNSAKNSLIFDGASDVLANTDAASTINSSVAGTDTAITVFATLQCTAASQDQSIICWDNSAGNEQMNIRTDNTGDNLVRVQRIDASGSSAGQSGAVAISTNRKTIAMYFSGTTVTTWINGVMDLNAAALDVGVLTTLDRFRIGNGNTGSYTGRVAEVVVYTGDKSSHVASYHSWASSTWGGF